MTEGELDSLLFDAYLLGQRVLYETGNVAPVSTKTTRRGMSFVASPRERRR